MGRSPSAQLRPMGGVQSKSEDVPDRRACPRPIVALRVHPLTRQQEAVVRNGLCACATASPWPGLTGNGRGGCTSAPCAPRGVSRRTSDGQDRVPAAVPLNRTRNTAEPERFKLWPGNLSSAGAWRSREWISKTARQYGWERGGGPCESGVPLARRRRCSYDGSLATAATCGGARARRAQPSPVKNPRWRTGAGLGRRRSEAPLKQTAQHVEGTSLPETRRGNIEGGAHRLKAGEDARALENRVDER